MKIVENRVKFFSKIILHTSMVQKLIFRCKFRDSKTVVSIVLCVTIKNNRENSFSSIFPMVMNTTFMRKRILRKSKNLSNKTPILEQICYRNVYARRGHPTSIVSSRK